MALLFLMYELVLAAAWIPWAATATFAVLAGAYLITCVLLGGDWEDTILALGAGVVGWAALAPDPHLGSWRGSMLAAPGLPPAPGAFRAQRPGPPRRPFAP